MSTLLDDLKTALSLTGDDKNAYLIKYFLSPAITKASSVNGRTDADSEDVEKHPWTFPVWDGTTYTESDIDEILYPAIIMWSESLYKMREIASSASGAEEKEEGGVRIKNASSDKRLDILNKNLERAESMMSITNSAGEFQFWSINLIS